MKYLLFLIPLLLTSVFLSGQNPLIMDQFTADPSARVFNGRVYVYPSHDIIAPEGKGLRENWFCMEDYHVYSSENLTEWTDHGMILSQYDVDWVDSTTYSMWAPDCIERNGKYYFYFPAIEKNPETRRRNRIGVAVSDSPTGPFTPEPKPIEGVYGIDPNPFIDTDGQAYLYWGAGEFLYMAKLKENMLELATEPEKVVHLQKEFKEGAYMFERNGIYYFTYPYVPETTERLVYATGDNPMGPFEYRGVIMKESPNACWTNHHSIIEYNNQWLLFYHHNDLSPHFDKNRSIKADSLFFNPDGTIREVIPTWRGVGISNAEQKVQIDRYSAISDFGISVDFVDSLDTHQGWKVAFEQSGAWLSYNHVDFSNPNLEMLETKLKGNAEVSFEIRLNSPEGKILASVQSSSGNEWKIQENPVKEYPGGTHNLFVVSTCNKQFEIDWVRFK
jgi:hypothetical protein